MLNVSWQSRPVFERAVPQKIFNRLTKITTKNIRISTTYKHDDGHAVTEPGPNYYEIRFDEKSDLAEQGLVHELIHVLLFEEGFPFVVTNDLSMSGEVTNQLHHPEVFRRMREETDLDTDTYFATHWRNEARRANKNIRDSGYSDAHIMILISDQFAWHFIGDSVAKELEIFRELSPLQYEFTYYLYQEAQHIGFDTPEKMRRLIEIFTVRAHRFCLDHVLNYDCAECPHWKAPKIVTMPQALEMFADEMEVAPAEPERRTNNEATKSKLFIYVGLPASGKLRYMRTQARKWPCDPSRVIAQNFFANPLFNAPGDFTRSRHFKRLVTALKEGRDCAIEDIEFCRDQERSDVASQLEKHAPGTEIIWTYFENDPKKCMANAEHRNGDRVDDEKKYILELSVIYRIPPDAIPILVWQP